MIKLQEGKIYVHTRYEEVPTCIPRSDWEHDGDSVDGFGEGRYICKKNECENCLELLEINEEGEEERYGDNPFDWQVRNCQYLYEEAK